MSDVSRSDMNSVAGLRSQLTQSAIRFMFSCENRKYSRCACRITCCYSLSLVRILIRREFQNCQYRTMVGSDGFWNHLRLNDTELRGLSVEDVVDA